MTDTEIADDFKKKVCAEIEIRKKGIDRYVVNVPFTFTDGDHFVVLLRKRDDAWYITDEGHTFMHLSYHSVDIHAGTRGRVVEEALSYSGVENNGGELRIAVRDGEFGDALFSYLQALAQVVQAEQLTQDRARSMFTEDLAAFLTARVPSGRLIPHFVDQEKDPEGMYPVDYRIDPVRGLPVYLFGIQNDSQCKDAMISVMRHLQFKRHFHPVAVFERQVDIAPKVLARLTDVMDEGKTFSSLSLREAIETYLKKHRALVAARPPARRRPPKPEPPPSAK